MRMLQFHVACAWFTELPHVKTYKLKRLYKGRWNIWIIGGGRI